MIERETTLKQDVIDALHRIPDDASLDDIVDCAILISKIREGIAQVEQGMVISHENVIKQMGNWLR